MREDFCEIVRRIRRTDSTTVTSSDVGNESQIPWIPHREEKAMANTRMATAPRTMEMIKEGFGRSVAAK